jgi:hypothetical protein
MIPKMGIATQAPEGRQMIAQDEALGKPQKNRTESRWDDTSADPLHLKKAEDRHPTRGIKTWEAA